MITNFKLLWIYMPTTKFSDILLLLNIYISVQYFVIVGKVILPRKQEIIVGNKLLLRKTIVIGNMSFWKSLL